MAAAKVQANEDLISPRGSRTATIRRSDRPPKGAGAAAKQRIRTFVTTDTDDTRS